ncbi:hypothetical protein [Nitrososphaera viennensis]|nr:hypothetical protein [Nitrososphaera viennensis]UVS69806.1 hypothetical protein NWT39_03230 [Nitrososphaera viennensis]
MSQKIGETKATILESCVIPKSWSELVKITGKTEPTLMVHLNDLQGKELIAKTDQGFYETTEAGKQFVELVPNIRPVDDARKRHLEAINVLLMSLGKKYTLEEKLAAQVPALVVRGYVKKDLGAFANAVGQALRSSVTLWLPTKMDIDPKLLEEIAELVAKMIKKKAVMSDGKIRIVIEVDFPKALDMRIREEKDPKIKQTLIDNRDKIIKDVVDHWDDLFERN